MNRYFGKFKGYSRALHEQYSTDEITGLRWKKSMRIDALLIPHDEFVVLDVY
jgi:hypothetical protein